MGCPAEGPRSPCVFTTGPRSPKAAPDTSGWSQGIALRVSSQYGPAACTYQCHRNANVKTQRSETDSKRKRRSLHPSRWPSRRAAAPIERAAAAIACAAQPLRETPHTASPPPRAHALADPNPAAATADAPPAPPQHSADPAPKALLDPPHVRAKHNRGKRYPWHTHTSLYYRQQQGLA